MEPEEHVHGAGCGDATEEEKLAVEAMPENYGAEEFAAAWDER